MPLGSGTPRGVLTWLRGGRGSSEDGRPKEEGERTPGRGSSLWRHASRSSSLGGERAPLADLGGPDAECQPTAPDEDELRRQALRFQDYLDQMPVAATRSLFVPTQGRSQARPRRLSQSSSFNGDQFGYRRSDSSSFWPDSLAAASHTASGGQSLMDRGRSGPDSPTGGTPLFHMTRTLTEAFFPFASERSLQEAGPGDETPPLLEDEPPPSPLLLNDGSDVEDGPGHGMILPAKPAQQEGEYEDWDFCGAHDLKVRAWLDEMPLGYDRAGVVPLDLWRGLPVSRMLAQGPSLMSNSQTEATYLLSEQLDEGQRHIDIFLSHTWSSDEYLKYTAMLYHFNGRFSFLAAHFAALFTFLALLAIKELTPYGSLLPCFYVPMPGNVDEYPRGLPVCGPCFFAGCVMQIATYVFGHFIWFGYRKTVFLDKCCIHQTDVEKKRRGVEFVGSFVKQSNTMFIPFDDDYFERLWCTYELAAFVRYRRSKAMDAINFMPIKTSVFVFTIAVVGFVGTSGFMFMCAVNDLLFQFWLPQNWFEYFAIWGTGGTLIFGVPKFIFCHMSLQSRKILDDQLSNFSVSNAKVTVEDDRRMIEEYIREWFGSVELFDQIVQRLFPDIVNRSLGTRWQGLRFADVLQENAGVLFLFIYDAVLVANSPRRIARALAIGFSAHLVVDPLFLFLLNMLAAALLRLPFSTMKNHAIRGVGVFVVGLIYPAWFAFCIASPFWLIAAVAGGFGVFVPLIFKK